MWDWSEVFGPWGRMTANALGRGGHAHPSALKQGGKPSRGTWLLSSLNPGSCSPWRGDASVSKGIYPAVPEPQPTAGRTALATAVTFPDLELGSLCSDCLCLFLEHGHPHGVQRAHREAAGA